MQSHSSETLNESITPTAEPNWHVPACPEELHLMYTGMDTGEILMDEGKITDLYLSTNRIGIQGNHLVRQGMELTLFIYLPRAVEPVCIAQTRVAWASGYTFTVEMFWPTLEVQDQLRSHIEHSPSNARGRCRVVAEAGMIVRGMPSRDTISSYGYEDE